MFYVFSRKDCAALFWVFREQNKDSESEPQTIVTMAPRNMNTAF
jgi:hypothetical protein